MAEIRVAGPVKTLVKRRLRRLERRLRLPDPENPVDPRDELIVDDGLTWQQRCEIEARGRMTRRLQGKE